jgi:parallel beta-helix repeat protein
MGRFSSIVTVLLVVVPCSARTLTVDANGSANYGSIQEAIDDARHGDTIVVSPGTYRERVSFKGWRITVRSEDPQNLAVVRSTIIESNAGPSVVFEFGERKESVLTGFTITGGGILCSAASPTIVNNVIRNCTEEGVEGKSGAAPTIEGNEILANVLDGIYSCDGLIRGNTISGNGAGIAYCNGPILDNMIFENGSAGGLCLCDGEIAGNTIVDNHTSAYGGGLFHCGGLIHNNIIAGNRADFHGGGLYECSQTISNNTIVGNRAGAMGGGLGKCTGVVSNNIIAFNDAPQGGGVHGPGSYSYNAFWSNSTVNLSGGAVVGVGDIVVNPLFVLGGYWDTRDASDTRDDVWVHGDYHLKSQAGHWDRQNRRWVADKATSPCIDAGKPNVTWAAELWPHGKRVNLGAYGGTPEASLSPAGLGQRSDLNHDEQIGPPDLKLVAENWLARKDLLAEDLNRNGVVDFNDFAALARDWRTIPAVPSPPLPSPMTWAEKPHATGPYSMTMVATMATSTDGTVVEYYFEDFYSPTYNSGWISFDPNEKPRWNDTDLKPETRYWYRVKARNRGNRLETAWSEQWSDQTHREDLMAPLPNPMTWQTEPHGVGGNTIRMTATTAADDSGVEYQFECTSHPAYGRDWGDSPTYEITSVPQGHYRFRVRARDKSLNHNTTGWSTEVAVDLLPPSPDPMKWETAPKKIQVGTGTWSWYATMTAVEATDESGDVEYYFECTNRSGFSSGWQKGRTYTVGLGGQYVSAKFRVKARDTSPSHNETKPSPEMPAL